MLIACLAGISAVGFKTSFAVAQAADDPAGASPFKANQAIENVPFQVSPDCSVPGNALSSLAPLPNTARAIKLRKTVRLLFIGATSVARRERADGGYDLLIETLLEKTVKGLFVDVIERGVSGELAKDAATRLQIEVALTNPDLVLWQVGTNDALAGISVAEIEQTIRQTVRWLKAHNVDVILVGLHYANRMRRDRHYQRVRAAIKSLAKSENVMRIGRYEAAEIASQIGQKTALTSQSGLEQTEDSYNCLAQHIARGITIVLFAKQEKAAPRK